MTAYGVYRISTPRDWITAEENTIILKFEPRKVMCPSVTLKTHWSNPHCRLKVCGCAYSTTTWSNTSKRFRSLPNIRCAVANSQNFCCNHFENYETRTSLFANERHGDRIFDRFTGVAYSNCSVGAKRVPAILKMILYHACARARAGWRSTNEINGYFYQFHIAA